MEQVAPTTAGAWVNVTDLIQPPTCAHMNLQNSTLSFPMYTRHLSMSTILKLLKNKKQNRAMKKSLLFLRALFSPEVKLNKPLAKISNDIYKTDEKTPLRAKKNILSFNTYLWTATPEYFLFNHHFWRQITNQSLRAHISVKYSCVTEIFTLLLKHWML